MKFLNEIDNGYATITTTPIAVVYNNKQYDNNL